MRKNFVRTLALVGMVGMMSSTGLVAHAAEAPATQTQVVKQNLNASVIAKVFDAKYYAEKNADVVAVLGTDPATLLNHYMTSGIYEGRDASATFNASIYALANPDIKEVYGDNLEAYVEHFIQFGAAEGRIATGAQMASADPATKKAISESISTGKENQSIPSFIDAASLDDPDSTINNACVNDKTGQHYTFGQLYKGDAPGQYFRAGEWTPVYDFAEVDAYYGNTAEDRAAEWANGEGQAYAHETANIDYSCGGEGTPIFD
ncbi:hypothetical protein SAMN04487830_10614 [Pseudobutyrivibrio sp. OR37]|uniref:hypothetical protein n=1 Tax=Pseudobutyrivibrio sp. OR37 TaxID=1798186 RepID=UPI0008DF699F|nr:hypothetical protein [Pseudobutyrivibrio sp. OR37]SFH70917.1 hypothetical protein SAMN04487830_10614 [Pseudobutyrivibrio sp. OR37]